MDVRKYGWDGVFKKVNEKWEARQGRDSGKQKRGRSHPLTNGGGAQLELRG